MAILKKHKFNNSEFVFVSGKENKAQLTNSIEIVNLREYILDFQTHPITIKCGRGHVVRGIYNLHFHGAIRGAFSERGSPSRWTAFGP